MRGKNVILQRRGIQIVDVGLRKLPLGLFSHGILESFCLPLQLEFMVGNKATVVAAGVQIDLPKVNLKPNEANFSFQTDILILERELIWTQNSRMELIMFILVKRKVFSVR